MNLEKLFEMQKKLDETIEKNHPTRKGEDRLSKKVLALLVELSECAQESRCFKFWSNDQEPRTEVENKCLECKGEGFDSYWTDEGQKYDQCECCCGTGIVGKSNPLLEEYVDCLHFILSIGNDVYGELAAEQITEILVYAKIMDEFLDAGVTFIVLNSYLIDLIQKEFKYQDYKDFITIFLNLGLLLGFTWEQIEQAYYDKNKVNFERQEQGY